MKEMATQEIHLASAARLMNSEDGNRGLGELPLLHASKQVLHTLKRARPDNNDMWPLYTCSWCFMTKSDSPDALL